MLLLERESELQLLQSDFDDAEAGHGRVILIRGEAGIGKTTLIRQFLTTVEDRAHVLTGSCDDLLAQRPLAAVRDMSLQEPELATALDDGPPSVSETVLSLVSRGLRPTVMVIEDVHWADDATLDLIRHVGRRIGPTHGLLLLTYRDEDVWTDHPLRFILGDLPSEDVRRIALHTLSLSAVQRLAAEKGRDVELVFSESGGNPFFVTELLDVDAGALPISIVEALRARVARLSHPADQIAELVSVVPGRAPMALIQGMHEDWAAALDEAEQRGVLVITPSDVAYRHELARRAIETSLTTARRIELNRQVLTYFRDRESDVARLIHHAAEAGDYRLLLENSPGAARDALAVGSNSQAVQYFDTLRGHYQELPLSERAALLEDWSYAAHIVNRLPDALAKSEEAVDLWRQLGEPLGLGRALRWNSRLQWLSGRRDPAKASVDEAIAVLETVGVSAELAYAYSARSQLMMLAYENEEAIELADKAIDVARKVGDETIEAHALVNRGSALGNLETLTTEPGGVEFEALKEALSFAELNEAWDELARGSINLAWGGLASGDIPLTEAYSIKTIEVCDQHELLAMRHYGIGTLAEAKRLGGLWYEAEDLSREVLGQYEMWATSEILNRSVLGSILARRGDHEARIHLERAWELARETREAQRTMPISIARAEMAWVAGDDDLARRLVGDEIERVGHLDVAWSWSELLMLAHRLDIEVDAKYRLRDPHRSAVAGDATTAAAEFGKLGFPFEKAVALLEGDREQLLEGLSILDGLGATGVAARVRADLRKQGVKDIPRTARPAGRTGQASLTARQQDVMELLAEGLTNAEIADRLFVSPRTVDHHVSAILSKLSVGSRQEAVEAFSA